MFDWYQHSNSDDPSLEATYKFEAYIDLDFDTSVTYYSDAYVDYCVSTDFDLDGNSAFFNVDVQAYGDDTAVEANVLAWTNDSYSSLTITGFSITD